MIEVATPAAVTVVETMLVVVVEPVLVTIWVETVVLSVVLWVATDEITVTVVRGVETVTVVVPVTPIHEQALEYLTAPEQGDAYAGIGPSPVSCRFRTTVVVDSIIRLV
jgi:hypothetical protein